MSRRHSAEKREIIPDAKFGDVILTKFMNSIMYDGKKSIAEAIVYDAFDIIEQKTAGGAARRFSSRRWTMSRRRSRCALAGSAARPIRCRSRSAPERRQALAIRWIITAARGRNDKTMVDRLSAELMDAANNRGNAVKKREDTHRMAEANRAFSHYRW